MVTGSCSLSWALSTYVSHSISVTSAFFKYPTLKTSRQPTRPISALYISHWYTEPPKPGPQFELIAMAQGYSVFIGLVVVAAMCVAAWFLSPKGENQTTWRSSLIIAFVSCYLMWFVTFMAQLHPLIEPRRSNIKEGFQHE
ncbi:ATP synthase subunit H-domain-containing protein [Xylaria palmicola]|nr:ATP synthase subunit H-domain-containing protein [Xylaria palmicola]